MIQDIGPPINNIEERKVLTRPNTTCPAVKLAASRKERVMGRTAILTVSTMTKKGFNQEGAPPGRREAAAEEGEKTAPDTTILSQRGRPIERENNK